METKQVSKFQFQTTNIKHRTRQLQNAQKNKVDSQLTGRKSLISSGDELSY